MTTSAAEGTDTFGSTAPNVYPNIFQAGNGLNNFTTFRIITKNVRGLKTEERIHELITELETAQTWDIIILNETWRVDEFEMWALNDGHLFANAGCEAGRRGVGFLVHRKWIKFLQSFTPVSERVATLTLRKNRFRIKIVGVYFPHCGYPDESVQQVYDILGNILQETRATKDHIVIAGDFNAEIGVRQVIDNQRLIGEWSVGEQNYRGFILKRWCELNDMSIANTLYPKRKENIFTYVGPNKHERQIDFALLSRKTRRLLRNAGSTEEVDLGSDHRAIEVVLELAEQKKRRKQRKRAKTVAWQHVKVDEFRMKTDELIRSAGITQDVQTGCEELEKILLEAAALSVDIEGTPDMESNGDEQLRELLERRRTMGNSTAEKTEISKQIQKHVRRMRRERQHEKISETLAEFRDLKRIPRIKTVQKKKLIVQMSDQNGQLQTDRKAMADIFADFYEELYASHEQAETFDSMQTTQVPPFTLKELTDAVRTVKSKKCADTNGIRAEMLKSGGEYLLEKLLELYNVILSGCLQPPASWKHSVISVIHKSGDAMQPQNYRPICIIPILYKLFSKLMYRRLYPILDKAQCKDQAGFRNKYSTVDHMFVFTMLQEKSEEFNLNTWVAAIDFKKAFDSINQDYLWHALEEQNVAKAYVNILRNLYAGQSAQVKTDVLSRKFGIYRGTKQGDPLSSLLFNALLERVMSRVKKAFVEKKYGIQMGFGFLGTADDTRLTNLRSADDVLITGRTLQQLSNMLLLLRAEAEVSGLQLHPDKTKIISSTNREHRPRQKCVRVGDMKIEVLARNGKIKYLGKQITFEDATMVELSNRIKAAWAKFMQHKSELTKKTYSLLDRLRLFEFVVTPTVLYGCEAWALTAEMTKLLKTTQRRMLRAILGQGRRRMERTSEPMDDDHEEDDFAIEQNVEENVLEPWVDWIRRVTHAAEANLQKLKIRAWTEQARKRKWRFAAELFSGSGGRKWSHLALQWNPQVHSDTLRPNARRKPTRPNLRWTDELSHYVKDRLRPVREWNDVCSDPDFWKTHESNFINRESESTS